MAQSKPKRGSGPTTTRQRQERAAKLRDIRKQVKEGTLKIRQMTAAERKKYPPRPKAERRSR